jgi:hypothetical protein
MTDAAASAWAPPASGAEETHHSNEMETTMKTTTRRAALVASAGVAAAIGSALATAPASAGPASPEGPATITTDVTANLVCGERNRQVGSENGAIAYVTTTCGGNPTQLTVSGWVDDTEQDGNSACVRITWPDGFSRSTSDANDDNLVTHFPNNWKHAGNRVRVRVWTC